MKINFGLILLFFNFLLIQNSVATNIKDNMVYLYCEEKDDGDPYDNGHVIIKFNKDDNSLLFMDVLTLGGIQRIIYKFSGFATLIEDENTINVNGENMKVEYKKMFDTWGTGTGDIELEMVWADKEYSRVSYDVTEKSDKKTSYSFRNIVYCERFYVDPEIYFNKEYPRE